MRIEVRPLDIPKWHGKAGKEAFSQAHTIEALYDHKTGGLATGLTEEEAKTYGEKLGVNLSSKFDQSKPHEFWGSAMGRIKLENKTMIFEDTKALDFVKVRMMKASKYVANSIKEWEAGKYPDATHVIYDEEQDIAIKASRIQAKNNARKIAMELSAEDKINLVQILSNRSLKGKSQNHVDIEIDSLVEDRTKEFLSYANRSSKELYLRGSILEALQRNILTKEGSSIYYLSDQIGFDFESTLKYFDDPQNQNIKLAILEKLNS